ncbi:hypothetical protein ACO0LF_31265 [Undibacterium sp. Di27W]|uniref:hypothetical protein n=1 Tax=Undibacterium sp. Di27W TaxID=3413036 RepID=UPI003BF1F24B
MKLMIVQDVMLIKGKGLILTGRLLLSNVVSKSDVEGAFGSVVMVVDGGGNRLEVPVKAISVTQSMAGSMQVSLGIDELPGGTTILIDSLVSNNH